MIARTEDYNPVAAKRFVVYPAGFYKKNDVLTDSNGFTYTFTHDSYKFSGTPETSYWGGWDPDDPDAPLDIYDGHGVNEYGLACSATNTTEFNAINSAQDPAKPGVPTWQEQVIPTIILSECKNIEEALALIKNILETSGNTGDIFMIADENEAWLIESISRYRWVASRVPDDSFAIVANDMVTERIDLLDANYRGTPDFQAYAEGSNPGNVNFAKYNRDGSINIALTFASTLNTVTDTYRRWRGYTLFAPNSGITPITSSGGTYQLFVKPEKKISALDIMDMQRDRYNGTPYDLSESPQGFGAYGEIEPSSPRPIGHYTQEETHIYEMVDGYPHGIGGRFWMGMAQSEHSVKLPFYGSITDTHPFYKTDIFEPGYRADSVSMIFIDLAKMCRGNRKMYGKPVQDYWRAYEEKFFNEQPAIESEMLRLYSEEGADAAAKFVTDYTIANTDDVVVKALRIRSALIEHITEKSGALFVLPSNLDAPVNDATIYSELSRVENAALGAILNNFVESGFIDPDADVTVKHLAASDAPSIEGHASLGLQGLAAEVSLRSAGSGAKARLSLELDANTFAAFNGDIENVKRNLSITLVSPGIAREPVTLIGPDGVTTLKKALEKGIATLSIHGDGAMLGLDLFLVDGLDEPAFANDMLIASDGHIDGKASAYFWAEKNTDEPYVPTSSRSGGCSSGLNTMVLALLAAAIYIGPRGNGAKSRRGPGHEH
jgi:dipeptidase